MERLLTSKIENISRNINLMPLINPSLLKYSYLIRPLPEMAMNNILDNIILDIICFRDGNIDNKFCPFIYIAFNLNPAMMALNNPIYNRKP